jgi:cysteinyl-tRNA synthetase
VFTGIFPQTFHKERQGRKDKRRERAKGRKDILSSSFFPSSLLLFFLFIFLSRKKKEICSRLRQKTVENLNIMPENSAKTLLPAEGLLKLYNSLTRQKELFQPLRPPFVGMYVCGPTVYNFVHLGNVRTFLSFDVLYRYLLHLGYKVRYVRNITDVGHLENDGDEGEDKIDKKARLEQLEPMEVVQRYTNDFRQVLQTMNLLPPGIEPSATGHMLEQIETIEKLIANGYAYESEGSVYFDVKKYNDTYQDYGQLSGRKIEELLTETRELDGQADKRNPLDFAVWKKASPQHIMRWHSPWSEGFPGWHLECTCMSNKYLGEKFDIHGGGMDLKFPHHECEIAQATAATGQKPVNYWLHANMLTVNGEKMSKSKGNSILPADLFSGDHVLLNNPCSPMTFRFFALQAQYRSTLDITNEALEAARKGYKRLMNGLKIIKNISYQHPSEDSAGISIKDKTETEKTVQACYNALNDDLNTAVAIAELFNLLKKIHQLQLGQITPATLSEEGFDLLKNTYITFIENILGLKEEKPEGFDILSGSLLSFYKEAKTEKNYTKVDEIRAEFKKIGIVIKDMKTGIDWAYEE